MSAGWHVIASSGGSSLPSDHGIIYADRFAGVDWGEKVAAAFATVPAGGAIVSAVALSAAQEITIPLEMPEYTTLLVGASTISNNSGGVGILMKKSCRILAAGRDATVFVNNVNDDMIKAVDNAANDARLLVLEDFTIQDGMIGGIAYAVIRNAGSAYSANDVVDVAGGSDGQIRILTVDGSGKVLTISIESAGSGYSTTIGAATSYGGAGTGFTVNVSPRTAGAGVRIDGEAFAAIYSIKRVEVFTHLYGFRTANHLLSEMDQCRAKNNLSHGFYFETSSGGSTTTRLGTLYALSNGGYGVVLEGNQIEFSAHSVATGDNGLGGLVLLNNNGGSFAFTCDSLDSEGDFGTGLAAVNATNLTFGSCRVSSVGGSPGHGIYLDGVRQATFASAVSSSNLGAGIRIIESSALSNAITFIGLRANSNTGGRITTDGTPQYMLINSNETDGDPHHIIIKNHDVYVARYKNQQTATEWGWLLSNSGHLELYIPTTGKILDITPDGALLPGAVDQDLGTGTNRWNASLKYVNISGTAVDMDSATVIKWAGEDGAVLYRLAVDTVRCDGDFSADRLFGSTAINMAYGVGDRLVVTDANKNLAELAQLTLALGGTGAGTANGARTNICQGLTESYSLLGSDGVTIHNFTITDGVVTAHSTS